MSCRRVQRELIERFRFGELDARSAPHLAHLHGCTDCRDEVGLERSVVHHLQRALAERVADRSTDIAALTNAFLVQPGPPWRPRLGEIAVPTLIAHGTDDPVFPYAHAEALAAEIPGAELLALEHTGHEYFPPHTWDTVVPAIIRLTASPR